MNLYLVRHGIAVSRETEGIADEERTLTEDGAQKMHRSASGLARLGVSATLILTSPLPRARQTADILREALGRGIPLEECPALAPGGARPDIYGELRSRSKAAGILIVGHQPSLGEIGGEIAWGSSDACLELKKGGACLIEMDAVHPRPRGTLRWLLTPAILRRIGS